MTVFPVPTFLSANVADPAASVTLSPETTPAPRWAAAVAAVVPSYTLSEAVMVPVRARAVIFAVAVAVVALSR